MSTIDESILANLTDEERAALEAPDSDSEHQEVDLEQVAAQQQQQQQEEGEEGDPEKKPEEPEDKKPEEQQEQPDQQEEQQPAKQEQQPEAQAPQPLFKSVATEELKAKYTDIDNRENELVEKFEEGDLTTREYNAQLRALNKERGDLEWQERKAELNRESVELEVQRQWEADVNAFLPNHPEIRDVEENWNSFNTVLLQVTGASAAQGKGYGAAELDRAYRIWADERGIVAKEPAPAKQEQKPEPEKAKAKPLDIPPSLAKVPAAAPEDTDDGKFAALDRMAESDPQKYQETIARMSADEYDAYTRR
ncbi:hypothetical protein [Leclercia sp.]|uniref:hypothetical protein n=1 Tax=Leclercia sp. TaxID=1898428 RepID=UPI0028BE98BA|nr:hypothetical protein [Leclercia sp.]